MLEVVIGEGPNPKVEVESPDGGVEEYRLAPLRLTDFGEFRDWVKEKRLKIFMRAAKAVGMDIGEIRDNIQSILGVTPNVDTENEEVSDDVIAQMSTEEGMEHLVWLSIRRNHPEVEKDDLALNFSDLEELTAIIAEISGLPAVDQEDDKPGNPPEAPEVTS